MVATLGQILPEAARRFGDKTALVVEGATFGFAELDALSSRVAHGLVSVGVAPGDRVTLYGPNCWEWVVAYYAIAKTGAVVNPISSMLTSEEVGYVVRDSGARVLVTSGDKGQPLLDLVGTDLEHLVTWGSDVPHGATSLAQWTDGADHDFPLVPRAAGDLGAICYTSGTTGHPKGAMQSNRSVVAAGVGTVLMGARGPDDRVLNSLPLAHVYGSCVLNAVMLAGSTLIMVPRFEADAVLAAIADPSGDPDGRRADGVLLPAGASRLRPGRPVEPDPVLGRRPDAARGEGARVHGADRVPDPRGVGHDRARRSRERQPGGRAEQARHHRHRLSRQRHAGRRHRGSLRSCWGRASAAS